MAQLIKLKRTSVEGRKPTTSNLELGELAINTYDGKIYFEKDNGTPSIREIATEDSQHFYTTSFDSRYVNLTGDETIAGNKTFSNNITITGNLSVEGTTTTIDSTTVNIGDNILELNYGGSQTTGGILIKDGTGDSTVSGSLLWDSTNDYWKAGKLGSEEEILLRNTHGVISGSVQVDIHNTTGYVANEHIDHSTVSIIAGEGLNGGGTIASSRTLNVDSSYKNASLNSFTQSAITVSGNGSTNILPRFSDTHEVENSKITSTDTLTTFTHSNHGNIIFTVSGSNGELLTVTDSNSGNLLEVNDTSGIDVFTVSAVGDVSASGAITASGITGLTSLNVNGNIYGSSFNGTGLVSGSITSQLPSGIVSQSAQTVAHLSNQDIDLGTGDITATTGSFDVIDLDRLSLTSTQTTIPPLQLTANSLNDGVGALRIDGSQADIFLNPSTATHTTVTFAVNNDQRLAFGMDNNSDFYITRRTGGVWYDDTLVLDRDTGEVTLGYDLTVNGNINATNGIISGSSQITDLTTHKETVSGASSYAVTHNLNEQYPIVQAWNTGTSQQELPTSVTTNSVNQVTVVFSTTFAGIIIVKK